jgi:hypothetical protein
MFNALSYDQDILGEQQANFLKKCLKERLFLIEDTIDIHLNVIGGLERWIDRGYMYKLTALLANEDKIQKKYPRCLRMIDHKQSYDMYDSNILSKEKIIL